MEGPHEHTEQQHIFPKSFGVIQAAGNIAIGTAELFFSFNFNRLKNILADPAAASDALHNILADTTFVRHNNEIHKQIDPEQIERRRKRTYTAIFAGATAVAGASLAKMGVDIGHTVDGQAIEDSLSIGAVAATSASFAFSSMRYIKPRIAERRRLAQGGKLSASESDALIHLRKYDIPSAGLALGGTLLQKYAHLPFNMSTFGNEILGVYGGWLGMKHFAPTQHNLDHHSHGHDHNHHNEH